MKKMLLVGMILLTFIFSIGCAGMDPQYQRNMVTNSAIWGGIGAATGCIIAEVAGGKCSQGIAIGGVSGAYLGAGNTPPSSNNNTGFYTYPSSTGYSGGSIYNREYQGEVNRLQREEQRRWEKNERERARNDAHRDFYGNDSRRW